MSKQVTIAIDVAAGTLAVHGALYLGETVDLAFTGVESAPRFVVLDSDGVTVLADNSDNDGILDLRFDALRKRFFTRSAKAFKVMAFGGDEDVYASGVAVIRYSPVVFDPVNRTPATYRGPKGDDGEEGHVGPMGPLTQAKDPDSGKWYNVYARKNTAGKFVLSLEQEESDPKNGGEVALNNEVVKLTGNQTVGGSKTFASLISSGSVKGSGFAATCMPSASYIDLTSQFGVKPTVAAGEDPWENDKYFTWEYTPNFSGYLFVACYKYGYYDAGVVRLYCPNGISQSLEFGLKTSFGTVSIPVVKGVTVKAEFLYTGTRADTTDPALTDWTRIRLYKACAEY